MNEIIISNVFVIMHVDEEGSRRFHSVFSSLDRAEECIHAVSSRGLLRSDIGYTYWEVEEDVNGILHKTGGYWTIHMVGVRQ